MKTFRHASLGIIVLASVFLMGFKKPPTITKAPIKKHYLSEQLEKRPLDLKLPNQNGLETQDDILATGLSNPASGIIQTTQIKSRLIELQGRVIMSQEPEIEKTKTADGAGIIINLRH